MSRIWASVGTTVIPPVAPATTISIDKPPADTVSEESGGGDLAVGGDLGVGGGVLLGGGVGSSWTVVRFLGVNGSP